MRRYIYTAAALLSVAVASSARAQVEWNASAPKEAAIPVAAASVQAAANPSRIYGEPTGDNVLFKAGVYTMQDLSFVVNDTGDRVGVKLNYLDGPGNGDDMAEDMTFIFPQMRYDKANKDIYLGDVLLAHMGTFAWNQYRNKDYKLGYEEADRKIDLGFNHVTKEVYSVYIEKVR